LESVVFRRTTRRFVPEDTLTLDAYAVATLVEEGASA
jgi:hypothetical protein